MVARIHIRKHPAPRPCEHPYRRPAANAAVCMDCGAAVSRFGRT